MTSWSTESTTSTHDSLSALNSQMGGRKRDTQVGALGQMAANLGFTPGINFGGYDQKVSMGSMGIGGALGAVAGGIFGAPGLGAVVGSALGATQITGYDVVGIVGGEVENMRGAVRDYVSTIQTVVKEAITAAEEALNSAIRGADAQREVLAYLAKVKLYIDNLVTQLLSFSDKIADVGNAWIAAQEKIGSNVKTATGNFSEGSTYSDDKTYNGSVGSGVAGGVASAGVAAGVAGAASVLK